MATQKKDSEKSEYVVAPRRTLWADGRTVGSGQPFTPLESDLNHLVSTGFLVKVLEEESDAGFGVKVGGLQIKGGRKPGGVVA